MTDNWDFYFLRVDDKPASTFVDLGAIDYAPVASLPFMAYIGLTMNAPRADGLSSQAEFDTLAAIEDALKGQLVGEGTDYVGRCTTNGCRDFFFYVAQPENWAPRVAACMAAFPQYKYEAESREEPDWSSYLEYLYPSPADRQTISNRRVCDALEENGDALTQPREIDHWAYFPDAAARDAYVAEAAGHGFEVRVLSEPDKDAGYGAQLWRVDVPSAREIDDVTLALFNIAEKHGGDYDGWECVVVRAD
jgi:hypothetical protein